MEKACRGCPWSDDVPLYASELIRLDRLLQHGLTLPLTALSRWKQDALLVVREELDRLRKEPDGG